MQESKKNIWIIVLVILVIGLAGGMAYMIITNNTKEESNKNTNKTVNESTNENVTESTNEVQDNNKENSITYTNYTNKEITLIDDERGSKLKLEVVNKELKAAVDGKNIVVKGLEKNIKSFTYSSDGMGEANLYLLVLNENNEIFVGGYGDEGLEFEKIETNETIKDITVKYSQSSIDYVGQLPISVVLENNEIRPIVEDDNGNCSVATTNSSKN